LIYLKVLEKKTSSVKGQDTPARRDRCTRRSTVVQKEDKKKKYELPPTHWEKPGGGDRASEHKGFPRKNPDEKGGTVKFYVLKKSGGKEAGTREGRWFSGKDRREGLRDALLASTGGFIADKKKKRPECRGLEHKERRASATERGSKHTPERVGSRQSHQGPKKGETDTEETLGCDPTII